MKRIIIHWTAGTHKASAYEKTRYHVLVQGDGTVVYGVPISRNEAPLKRGYAAHTLSCNTSSIGVSLCCAAGATESPLQFGKYPPTKTQLDVTVWLIAKLCRKYGIPCDAQHVLVHGEVEANLGVRQKGKWDLNRLPTGRGFPCVSSSGGTYLRTRIRRAITYLQKEGW